MKAYGKERCQHVERRVRRPYRGGRGCICCGPSGDFHKGKTVPNKGKARAEGKKEAEDTEAV